MRNKNYIVLAIGIGLFGVFAILIALVAVTAKNPEVARDEEGVMPATVKLTVYGSVRLPEAINRFKANGAKDLVTIRPVKEVGRLPRAVSYPFLEDRTQR